jgi:hypothetical protein
MDTHWDMGGKLRIAADRWQARRIPGHSYSIFGISGRLSADES